MEHVVDVVSAKATSFREGLKLAQRIGCNKPLVQMDNLEFPRLNEGHSMVAAPILDDCPKELADFRKATIFIFVIESLTWQRKS